MLRRFAAKYGITYPLLADAGSRVIRSFGILNTNMPRGDPFYGVPFPGMYLLDRSGRVQGKYFFVDHTTRPTASSLLMRRWNVVPDTGQLEIGTQHLRLTLQKSSRAIRPGQGLLVRAEIQINPGLHLYGPEMPEGYRPTTLAISETELLREDRVRFPAPELRHIAAVNETVPVYRGTVLVDWDLILKPFIPAGAYRLHGALCYQACSESECYLPEEVAFELPLRVEQTVARVEP